jgi:hypothetical protein
MTDTPVKNYDGLLDYYTQYATPDTPVLAQKKTLLSTFDIWQGVNHQLKQKQKTQVIDLLDQNSVFGTDSFSEFVRLFGPNIFVLWKAALLQKRILFMGAPPMEKACKFGKLIRCAHYK